jgi:DHA2 family multidrug resistance protein
MTATVMLNAFMVIMNNATINLALPPMMTAFGFNLDQIQWVITAYMIASAVIVPTVGWLGSLLGNRNLFLCGLVIFVASSMLCGMAWSGNALIFFRVLQGLGSGPISPMSMVFLTQVFPPQQRGFAMGLYGLGISCGPVIGPVLGGYVTEYFNWRMVFYMNVLPGIFGIILAALVLPKTREAAAPALDLPGLAMMATFLISLLIALSQGRSLGWDDPYIQRLMLIAAISFVAFLAIEFLRKEPLIDLRLYKNIPFAAVSLAVFMMSLGFWGTGFLQTFLLQRLLEYTPAQAGFVVLPGALAMACMTILSGRLADKIDRRFVVWGGLGMFALACYWFSFLSLDRPMSWMIWMIIARYVTIGLIFTPMNAVSMMVLPPDKVRMGSGLINLTQQGLGGTISLAVMTTFLQRRTDYHAEMMGQAQVDSSLPWLDVLAPVQQTVQQGGEIGAMADVQTMALVQRHLSQQAGISAYQDCFMLVVIISLAVMPLIAFLRQRQSE